MLEFARKVTNVRPPEIVIAARGARNRKKKSQILDPPKIIIAARGTRIREKNQKYCTLPRLLFRLGMLKFAKKRKVLHPRRCKPPHHFL